MKNNDTKLRNLIVATMIFWAIWILTILLMMLNDSDRTGNAVAFFVSLIAAVAATKAMLARRKELLRGEG